MSLEQIIRRENLLAHSTRLVKVELDKNIYRFKRESDKIFNVTKIVEVT